MEKYLINYDDINCGQKIGETDHSVTYQATLITNKSSRYAEKIINDEKGETEAKFKYYIEIIIKANHIGIIPFIGFCSSSQNIMKQNIIVTKYASHISLQNAFDKISKGENIPWWNPVKEYIIIYGIAYSMEYLHSINIVHERLTPSNILLDENAEPQITDFQLSLLYPSVDFSVQNLIKNKTYYYVDPYVLKNKTKVTAKSDVYSFAIVALQILTENIHIYEKEEEPEELINEIKNGLKPMIPASFPDELRNLLISCLNEDQAGRPTFKEIRMKLDSIINSMPQISTEVFKEYQKKISENKAEELSPEIAKMKDAADKGDAEMMYLYANKRLNGKNCQKNINEAILYFTMAKEKGNQAAIQQLLNLRSETSLIASSNENDDSKNADHNEFPETNDKDHSEKKEKLISLINDPIFDQPDLNINDTLNNIDAEIKKKNAFHFDKKSVEQNNFIFTEGAEERLQKLYNYIMVGVPVLLEGPTGTSKTLSSEIVCKLLGKELIRFNLSSETKTQDLIGRYVGDEKSWAGISQKDGPFSYAFKKGKVLLLDEINLASASVLQCIEEALDSGVLSIEIPGRPLKSINMHPDFRVIATQNPNKGSYANKRQNLGLKFYSRFQIINFPAFSEQELLLIGNGLAGKFGYNNNDVIKDLVKFHNEWSNKKEIQDDSQCFTIREIAATVKALSQNESIHDTIMTIYGARYQKKIKEMLKKELQKYPRLIKDSVKSKLPDFPGCYKNDSLETTVKSALFSLKNGRNIIIVGKEGCGKTQVALWISEHYNSKINSSDNEQQSFFCVCTEEIKVADLVGHQAPSGKSDGTSDLIKWQDGFLTKAVKQGKCSVLECIDEAPSTVTERLNGLLDQKYDNQQKYFEIPENSATPRVPIKESFRILATANIDRIGQMSPAFLNRFDIIVLENQINDSFNANKYHELIKTILNKHCTEISLKEKTSTQSHDLNSDEEQFSSDSDFEFSGTDYESDNDENSNETQTNSHDANTVKYSYSESIIPLIYEKIKNEKNISHISKLCSSVIKLLYAFQKNKKIEEKYIVEFGYRLLQSNEQLQTELKKKEDELQTELKKKEDELRAGLKKKEDKLQTELKKKEDELRAELKKKEIELQTELKKIEDELLRNFKKIVDTTDEPFFYKDSPTLCSFLAKLAAYSIIEQPVCITGPTGAGKTSAARAFARMRPHKSSYKSAFLMHSFHSGTKVSHFFGSTTLLDGKIVFHDGTLTKSLKLGLVFIADEFNLSTQSVMKSLALALDPTIGKNVFIPGIGQIINISPEFQFIACQNELGTLGRNAIPDSISHRFVYIDYPKPEIKDIQKICINISKENFENKDEFKSNDEELARNIANYMIKLNERRLVYIPQWSLRDITKLFRRIYPSRSFKKFTNITPLHHVLFYTMSVVSPSDVENVLKDVQSIMKISFNLDDKEVEEYINCYKAEPEIKEVKDKGMFLMKGNFGISINSEKSLIIDNMLPSLWNAIFQVYLSDDREPILLMGNSGFKTFLASHFLPNAQIITLNQETNVAQLLGTSGFMTNSEAKLFYIDYICKIIQRIPLIYELKEKWKNGNLKKDDVDPLINEAKKGLIPISFNYALDHLAEKLLDDKKDNQKYVLSNTTLEFRPGLFLNSILQGQSLILKDLSNLPTIVLERFNELFSGKQNITLSEDIHNTFTSADYKELTNFNDSFRVFATCPANSPTRLSEAVLSRFTVISVPEYSSSEQKIVLKSYIQNNKLCFNTPDIDKLSQFAESYYNKLKIQFTFPQIIKVIEITSKLNKETLIDCQKLNIGIALYRVLGGLLDSNKKKEALFDPIKSFFDIPEVYLTPKNDNPLKLQQKDNITGVNSNITNLFIKCSLARECKINVAFTKSFSDLLDLIHMILAIHNPLILEGPPGQGKHTAIYYIANMLNIEIVHIVISQSTKVEDLFGKEVITRQSDGIHVEMVETQFVKIIKSSNDSDKRFLIILENINSSSPALLNALVPIFNSHSTSILLPNGSIIEKGKFDIIGIFNTQQMSSSKDKLPSSLINSSIYHIVQKPKKSEILQIILTKFKYASFTDEEANRFYEHFNQARNILSNEGTSLDVFTLNDIDKYLLFRKLTKKFFDETTISQMIFAYKFSTDEMIQKILKELKLENMKFNPIFSYDIPPKFLDIRISDNENNSLHLPLISPPKDPAELSKINSLTLPQKHCLIFLACALLSKRSCVIQGDTASGKSYLIRLFSELVGAKLNVFQMNSDSNVSMLAGQSILNDKISQEDVIRIKKAFADLIIDKRIQSQIEDVLKIDIKNPETFNPKSLKKLLEYIKDIQPNLQKEKHYAEIADAVTVIKDIMNPVNRFEHKESAFVHAIRNGEWVLIDGIESAPSEIAEKISSLCGDNPELNLFEYGPEFFFSKNKNTSPKNKIHDDFHLFITFNPNTTRESQMIDQSFLVKSVTFSLPAIDDRIENSAQMLLGSLINLKYSPEESKELAARYAAMHQFAKLESKKNPENFAGDIQFNGRTIKFATKVFSFRNQKTNNDSSLELAKLIALSTKSFYWNSFTNIKNADDFHQKCMRAFKKNPENELLSYLQIGDMTPEMRNKKILILLRNIQKCILDSKSKSTYSLSYFLDLCNLTRISDLQYVQYHINDTLKIIKSNSKYKEPNKNPLLLYGLLYSISSLFKIIISPKIPIKQEHSFLSLKDEELRNNKSIVIPLTKIDLLIGLLNEKLFYERSSILFDNELYAKIINQMSIIAKHYDKKLIVELFKEIFSDNNLVDFIDQAFPYLKLKDSKLSKISFWLPLAKILIKQDITFSYTIDNIEIKFNESSTSEFSFDLIMNEKDNLSLSKNSTIHYSKRRKSMKVKEHDESENDKNDFIYYSMIKEFSNNPSQSVDEKILRAQLSKFKKLFSSHNMANSSNSILSLKDLFLRIKQQDSNISLMWNLVYTLPEDEIKDLADIIHPIESKLLLSVEEMFKKISKDLVKGIISWSNWASGFENGTPILYKFILQTDIRQIVTLSNIDEALNSINNEIIYLKRAPEDMKDFWDSGDLIEICEKELIQLQKIKNDNNDFEKELQIQKKIDKLKNDVIKSNVQPRFNDMKNDIINQLGQINIFTEDMFNYAQKIVNQFLLKSKSEILDDQSGFINWPEISFENDKAYNYHKTENIKLFETLIWYSQIKAILKEIDSGTDLLTNIWKLNDFEEMAYPKEMLFTNLFKNANISESGLTLKDKDQALYTLNANMILKLININKAFIKDPKAIYKAIDSYMRRSKCNESELQWIYHTVSTLSSDFCLQIPKFKPNDLVFLIVNKKSHSDYRNGPLFVGLKNLVFLKNMKQLMHQNFSSFIDAAKSIGQIVYRTISENEEPPLEYDKLKNAFNNKSRFTISNYEIAKKTKDIFMIAECLNEWKDQNLCFDDVTLLADNWMTKKDLVNRFPSLVFWICRYQEVANKLEERYKNFVTNQNYNQIPLWILALRMMSSYDCIEFEIKNKNKVSEIICLETSKLIKKYLSTEKNINYNWINILISNLPPQITDPYIKLIHDFFCMLSMDNQNHPTQLINQMKEQYMSETISKIIQTILSNNYQQLITDNFTNSNSLNQFLAFPSKYVHTKINESLFNISHKLSSHKSTQKLKNFLNTIKSFNIIISELQNAINDEQNSMKRSIERKIDAENERRKEQKIKEISSITDKYQSDFNDLIETSNRNKISGYIQNLQKYKAQLSTYHEIFKHDEIKIQVLTYSSYIDKRIFITKDKDEELIILPKTGKYSKKFYLLQNEKYNKKYPYDIGIEKSEFIRFKYINDSIDYNDIIKVPQYNENIPYLIFGKKNMKSYAFIDFLNELYKNLDLLETKFFKILEYKPEEISMDFFTFLDDINGQILDINENSNVRFSNNQPCESIRNLLHDHLKSFLDLLSPLFNDVVKLTYNILYPTWKVINENKKSIKLFSFQYDIQTPQVIKNPNPTSCFSDIPTINSLASPIVYVSPENKLICSVNKLCCSIGPLFSSNVRNPFSISIITFLNEKCIYKISKLSDTDYANIIKTKENVHNNEPIQLLINPPPPLKNEPEIIILEGNLNIKAKSLEPYNLPFKIKLGILPLKVRLHCLEYKLADEVKNLRLCCDRIESGAKITFEAINYFVHDQFGLAVAIESLDENEAEQPKVKIEKYEKRFYILLPDVKKPVRCQFNIKIALSQNLIFTVYCDFIIIPIVFTFEIYDYFTKRYESTSCEIIVTSGSTKTLFFRAMSLFPYQQKAQLSCHLPESIQITSDNISLNSVFSINKNYSFNINLHTGTLSSNSIAYHGKFRVTLTIGKFSKNIQLKFVNPNIYFLDPIEPQLRYQLNNDFLKMFPSYSYHYRTKKWEKICENDDLICSLESIPKNTPFYIISPYHYYTNNNLFNIIDYGSKNCISVSNSINISFYQLALTKNKEDLINIQPHNGSIFDKKVSIYDLKLVNFIKKTIYYYSIFGYTEDKKNWFPAFVKYPNIKNFKFLEYDEKYATIANENIRKMQREISSDSFKYFEDNINNHHPIKYRQNDFSIFMILLMCKNIILNINYIINSMPDQIKREFDSIINQIHEFILKGDYISPNICAVISHNLILKFTQVFSAKFNELKSHQFCLQSIVCDSEIEKQKQNALKEFMIYDPIKQHDKSTAAAFELISKEKEISNIKTDPLPGESKRKECFTIGENDTPQPCKITDKLGEFDFEVTNNDESILSDTSDSIISLPQISLPNQLSIDSLNKFYSTCSQGAAILPTYIRSKYIKNLNLKDSEKYFINLLSIYKEITKVSTHDFSILSYNVNSFIESFKNCVNRLRRAGVDFSSVKLPESLNNCNNNFNQDFIRYPEIETPVIRKIPWKTKHQISNNFIKFIDPVINKGKFASYDTLNRNFDENLLNTLAEEEEHEKVQSDELDDDDYQITEADKELILAKVASVVDDKNDDDADIHDLFSRSSKNTKQTFVKIDSNSMTSRVSDSKSIDGYFSQFKELDGIERVLRRIKEMNKDNALKFLNGAECIIEHQNELFKTNVTDFPVKILINNIQFLIAKLINSASDANCPFLFMSCNLLIDCSSFISIENKLYCFMLLASFSYALSSLEIPFSIAIVADQKFRFLLKPFEEDISVMVLQRVLDCLFIKRYRTNIADTFRYAIDYMKSPYQKRTQRAIFLFSNGLDENLVLAQSWKEHILCNANVSFGLIFVKPKLLDDPKYSAVQEMWDNFNKVTKTAKSTTRLIAINANNDTSTYDSIVTTFADVLNRNQNQKFQIDSNKTDAKPEFILKYSNLMKNEFEKIKIDIDYNFNEVPLTIFKKKDQHFDVIGSKFQKLDVSYYRNKTDKITTSTPENQIKDEFDQLIHKIIYSKRNLYRPLLETIFKPNKASQTVLSSTGTDFDITALILNLINPVPDPLIYLEEKGGLIRNYGISIIIDSSKSCFNSLSSSHSYQTIKTLFSALSSIDIPCIDVIIATSEAPIVLCSEISSIRLFNDKSTFWPSLFKCLSEQSGDNCDLEAAIHAAYDIRRMRSIDSSSFMFVITDGLYQKEQQERIKSHVMTCIQSGINVFGIGIGIYPKGIPDIFPQAIYATNPNYIIHGIASCFGDDSIDSSDKIKYLAPDISEWKVIMNSINELIKNENNPIFNDLKTYLSKTQHSIDAFSDMYNEEKEARDAAGELINPEGANTEMYVKDILRGQKILIVMLYDCRMNMKENPKIASKYLLEPESAGEKAFVKNAVAFYGIDIVIVQNYKDAVKELTKKTIKGKCNYYATWVMSGYPYDKPLPDGGNQYLVVQFIDCLIQFWKNGGSVVMFSEGEPLTFQTNLFLERIKFPNNTTTQLRVNGNHKGMKYLKADRSGKLNNPGTFNKHPLAFKSFERASLAHNLVQIYEGETISFAQSDSAKYSPFTPFMRDSENGISALYYPGGSDKKHQTGDIIIDCGYTKLFDKMTEKGTFRYIQNIAGWTAQCELRLINGIQPKDYRPKAVQFTLDETQKVDLQKPPGNSLKSKYSQVDPSQLRRVFAIDCSGSVNQNQLYHSEVQSIFKKYYKNGDIIITWESNAQIISFPMMQKIYTKRLGNGGTYPSQIAILLGNSKQVPREHLILVTDGKVDSSSIKESDIILKKNHIHFKYVTTYVIGDKGDLSVGAPFARGCGSKTIEIKSNGKRREFIGANSIDFSVLDSVDIIMTPEQFNKNFDSLFNATKQKMIGTSGDSKLQDQFNNLRIRLNTAGLTPEIDRRISVLIGMASGTIQDVFDIDTIVAMKISKT